ncbi:MAG: Mth938-like domain-containing protein [Bacteroidota bacterium]
MNNNSDFVISSPRISYVEWGKIIIEDQDSYKDVKCFPNGARTWDWSETGTKHTPGIQISDVEELLENGAEVLVLSKGFYEILQVHPNTEKYLKAKSIPFYNLQTEEAVKLYNELRKTKKVGGLFHSTC